MQLVLKTCLNRRVEVELSTGTRLMGKVYEVCDEHYLISDSGLANADAVSIAHTIRVKVA